MKLPVLLCLLVSLNWSFADKRSTFKDCYDCTYDPSSPNNQAACESNPKDVTTPTQTCNTPYGCIMTFTVDNRVVKKVTRKCPRLPLDVNDDMTGCVTQNMTGLLECSCDWSYCNDLDEKSARNIEDFRPTKPETVRPTLMPDIDETTVKTVGTTGSGGQVNNKAVTVTKPGLKSLLYLLIHGIRVGNLAFAFH